MMQQSRETYSSVTKPVPKAEEFLTLKFNTSLPPSELELLLTDLLDHIPWSEFNSIQVHMAFYHLKSLSFILSDRTKERTESTSLILALKLYLDKILSMKDGGETPY